MKVKIRVLFALFLVLLGAILIFSCQEELTASSDGDDPPLITDNPISLEQFSFEKAPTVNNTSITFVWTDNLSNVEYDVYLDTVNPPEAKINGDVPITTKSYTYSNTQTQKLEPKSAYYWKVVARDISTETETTSETSRFFTDDGISTTSLNGDKDVSVSNDLSFTWDIHEGIFSDAVSYRVYFGADREELTEVTTTALDTTSFTYNPDSELIVNTLYYWKVDAKATTTVDGVTSQIEIESTVASFRTEDGITLDTPADGTATIDVGDALTLDWTVVSQLDETVLYTLYLDTVNPPTKVAEEDFTSLTADYLLDTSSLKFNTTYYWKLSARKGTAINTESEVLRFITTNGISSVAPADNTVDVLKGTNINFDWDVVSGLVGGTYTVYFDTTSTPTTSIADNISATDFSYDTSSLEAGTYYWKVVATIGTRTTATETRSVTVEESITLVAPTNGAQDVYMNGTVLLDWNTHTDVDVATTYTVYLDVNTLPTTEIVNSLSATEYTYNIPSLEDSSITYYWKVVGTNGTDSYVSSIYSFTVVNPIQLVSPNNESTDVLIDGLTLDWSVSDLVDNPTYDIVFDTANPPMQMLAENINDTQYIHPSPFDLSFSTTYFWRVIAKQGGNEVAKSGVYSFTFDEIIQDGYVTVSRGGGPVSGATIELRTVTDTVFSTTTTDAKGYFSVSVQKGTWKIRATKSGRASSEATITIDDEAIPNLSLFQFPIESASKFLTPPSISISGMNPYESFTGDETSVVVVATASARDGNAMTHGNSRPSLAMSINNFGKYDQKVNVVEGSAELIQDMDISTLPYGMVYLEFVAYDNNNNQAVYILPIKNDGNSIDDATNMIRPGSSSATDIYIKAKTIGKEAGVYSLSNDSYVAVSVYVDISSADGIMLYRGTDANNFSYIGSSSLRDNFLTYGDKNYYYYSDRSPVLEDNNIYYYKVKYYKNNADGIHYSNLTDPITVPIMPRVQSTLVEPAHNSVYDTVPESINFTWNIEYADIPAEVTSKTKRIDKLRIEEVATIQNVLDTSSGTEIDSEAINSSSNMSTNIELKKVAFDFAGKSLFWTVNSILTYSDEVIDEDYEMLIEVESVSYPTVGHDSTKYDGSAQNASFSFAIKTVE